MAQIRRNKGDLVSRRKWIKLYPMECLNGSIRYQLTSEERGTWYDLLNFAAICTNHGIISDRDGRAYPHDFIANRLNIPTELLESTLNNCVKEGRVTEDEAGIHITNWKLYQSEYDRQKPYRKKQNHKQYGQFINVLLTDEEYKKLEDRFGADLSDKIEALSIGIESKGYKYNSHYATILNWARKDQKEQPHGKTGELGKPAKGITDYLKEEQNV